MALTPLGKQVAANPSSRVITYVDWEFRKNLCQELVFVWQDSNPDVRRGIERALFNVGVEQINGQWIMETHSGGRLFLGSAD